MSHGAERRRVESGREVESRLTESSPETGFSGFFFVGPPEGLPGAGGEIMSVREIDSVNQMFSVMKLPLTLS